MTNPDGVRFTWLGHATFKVETPGGQTVLIDPWVMGNPACPDEFKKLDKIDTMLCTHGHFDHIGDAVELAKEHNPTVVGVFELCGWSARRWSCRVPRSDACSTPSGSARPR